MNPALPPADERKVRRRSAPWPETWPEIEALRDGSASVLVGEEPRVTAPGSPRSTVTSNERVLVGDRLVPTYIEQMEWGDADTPDVRARLEVREGVPRLVQLHYSSPPGRGEIREAHFKDARSILDRLILIMAANSWTVDAKARTVTQSGIDENGRADREAMALFQTARANRRLTPSLLKEVAEVYRRAMEDGRHPTRAVKERYIVSDRQASNYVQRARQAGYLGPTTRGKKGG